MLLPRVFSGMFTGDAALADYAAWALRIYMAGIFSLGFQISCQQSFVALGQAKISLVLACLRKLILLIPLIYILPNFLSNQVFAVFLAEPISDILAATVTTVVFFARFQKILKKDYIPVRVQAEDAGEPATKALLETYQVTGLPTLLILSPGEN